MRFLHRLSLTPVLLLASLSMTAACNPPDQPAKAPPRSEQPPEPAVEEPQPEPASTPAPEAGHIELSPALVVGGLGMSGPAIDASTEAFRKTLERETSRLRQCYAKGLNRNPALAGTITLEITLQTDGSVYNVKPPVSTLDDGEVVTCVVDAMRAMPYASIEGKLFVVQAPLLFKP